MIGGLIITPEHDYVRNGFYAKTLTTDLAGLYGRSAKFGNLPPYQVTDSWVAKKPALKLETPFNFVSSLDIVGGNSGSPVVDRHGEIVGVVFDGNIQSLPGYFIYDAGVNRAVAVDSRAMRRGCGLSMARIGWSRRSPGLAARTRVSELPRAGTTGPPAVPTPKFLIVLTLPPRRSRPIFALPER